jgi:replicative DNA helicase
MEMVFRRIEYWIEGDAADQMASVTLSNNRSRDIITIAHSLKALAQENNIAFVVTLTLDHVLESRSDKRPLLSHIPDAWVQTADLVMALYREDKYIEDTDRQNLVDVMILKNRIGATGNVSLYNRQALGEFRDLETLDGPT